MPESKRTTIKLEEPILDGGTVLNEIILRAPLYADYRELGDPWTIFYDEKGRGAPMDRTDVIFAYVERCLVSPKNFLLLEHLTLGDARKLRQWVEGFFRQGVEAKEGSTTSSPTSSSGSAASQSIAP